MLCDSDFKAPPLTPVQDAFLQSHGIRLQLLRLDLIHPLISGNKWYKLKHNLRAARAQSQDTVLSFGGAYSNHLVALAAASKLSGLRSIGVVRGEAPKVLNPALEFAKAQGMELHFVSRSDYCKKEEVAFLSALEERFGPHYLIPEGGSNLLGARGCAEIAPFMRFRTQEEGHSPYVLLACGTAATLAGIASAMEHACHIFGISTLKGPDELSPRIAQWLQVLGCSSSLTWSIKTDFHHGGYGKTSPALNKFIERFYQQHAIALDHVYTGKMMWALYQMIEHGEIPSGSDIIAVHTGGLVPQS
jgi:1-aminocyclopropane-1-carboxylate deaminase